MSKGYYTFLVPVRGTEYVTVKASSLSEAIEKYKSGDYYIEPTLDDVDIDIGWCCNIDDYLSGAYIFSEEEESL